MCSANVNYLKCSMSAKLHYYLICFFLNKFRVFISAKQMFHICPRKTTCVFLLQMLSCFIEMLFYIFSLLPFSSCFQYIISTVESRKYVTSPTPVVVPVSVVVPLTADKTEGRGHPWSVTCITSVALLTFHTILFSHLDQLLTLL